VTPAQRKKLSDRLAELIASLATKQARSIEPSRADELDTKVDEDQQPLTEMSQAIASNLNRVDARTLEQCKKALARLKSDPDDFGNCQDCGDEIPFQRLEAMPYAELCVDCQGKNDAKGRSTRKKLTDFS
jgi:DnaK suppressor protein